MCGRNTCQQSMMAATVRGGEQGGEEADAAECAVVEDGGLRGQGEDRRAPRAAHEGEGENIAEGKEGEDGVQGVAVQPLSGRMGG